jgi:hypothetical protein
VPFHSARKKARRQAASGQKSLLSLLEFADGLLGLSQLLVILPAPVAGVAQVALDERLEDFELRNAIFHHF